MTPIDKFNALVNKFGSRIQLSGVINENCLVIKMMGLGNYRITDSAITPVQATSADARRRAEWLDSVSMGKVRNDAGEIVDC
jgi:hypothetical protein